MFSLFASITVLAIRQKFRQLGRPDADTGSLTLRFADGRRKFALRWINRLSITAGMLALLALPAIALCLARREQAQRRVDPIRSIQATTPAALGLAPRPTLD